jgi:hypothetical protein
MSYSPTITPKINYNPLSKQEAQFQKNKERQELAQLKKLNKFKEQYTKLGFTKELALTRSTELLKKSIIEQYNQETANKREIQIKRSADLETKEAQKLKAIRSAVAKGSFLGSLGAGIASNAIFGKAGGAVNSASSQVKDQQYAEVFNKKYGDKAYNEFRAAGIKSFASPKELASSFESLRNIVNDKAAKEFTQLASKISDLNYEFGQALGDIEGYLQGGGLAETGDFAKKFGRGEVEKLNALRQEQEILVSAGAYRSINDKSLVAQREKALSRISPKEKELAEVTTGVQLSNTVNQAKEFARERDISIVNKTAEALSAASGVKDLSEFANHRGFSGLGTTLNAAEDVKNHGLIAGGAMSALSAAREAADQIEYSREEESAKRRATAITVDSKLKYGGSLIREYEDEGTKKSRSTFKK